MSRNHAEAQKQYDEMTAEELERELREAFFCTDKIDGPLSEELERIREALDRKRPVEYLYTPEESWAHFLEDRADELEGILGPEKEPTRGPEKTAKPRRLPSLLRRGLVAAVIAVLLAGAALAAGPRLWVWVRDWSEAPEVSETAGTETGSPIQKALADYGITEPVYPAWLPQGYVLAEAHISEDPLLLYELYTREDRYISITVTPVTAVEKSRLLREDQLTEEYRAGETAHYLFSNSGSVTAVWYTDHYFVSINSNLYSRAMKRIIDSVYGR